MIQSKINNIHIDLSQFALKCNNNDCEKNENKRCCVSCKSYEDCLENNWICVFLEKHNSPQNCSELYLKKEGLL